MLEAEGWTVRVTKRGRIRATHPEATGALYGSSTPSDVHSIHQLRRDAARLLQKETQPEMSTTPIVASLNGWEPVVWKGGRLSEYLLINESGHLKCTACDWTADQKRGSHLHEMIHDGRRAAINAELHERRRQEAKAQQAEPMVEPAVEPEAELAAEPTVEPEAELAAEPIVQPAAEMEAAKAAVLLLAERLGVELDSAEVKELRAKVAELQDRLAAAELRLEAVRDAMGQVF